MLTRERCIRHVSKERACGPSEPGERGDTLSMGRQGDRLIVEKVMTTVASVVCDVY